MTKSIEDELNLPRIADALKVLEQQEGNDDLEIMSADEVAHALADMKDIRKELQGIDDFEDNETKLDDIQSKAIQAHQDLLDSGVNVEAKHAANFLEPSAQYLALALDSEKQKIDRKMKLLKLRLENEKLEVEKQKLELNRRKLDLAERQLLGDEAEVIDSNDDSFMAKRDEILRMAKGK